MRTGPLVMKFGGTSVADDHAFERVATIVAERISSSPVVIVSAISGMTDALVASARSAAEGRHDKAVASLNDLFTRHKLIAERLLADENASDVITRIETAADEIALILNKISEGLYDRKTLADSLLAYGEWLSSDLLAEVLNQRDLVARQVDPGNCILTDNDYGSATPLMSETFLQTQAVLTPLIETGVIPVMGGFVGATSEGITTTLGRGGSDYTAALVGASLGAREIQIWTDVTGVLTADPRIVPHARTIERLSYAEAAELAYFGARVLHPKTIHPAIEDDIPVRICNSREPADPGTLVFAETEAAPRTVKAIAYKSGVTTVQITSARMLGAYGFLRALFEVFERHRTVIDVVTTSEVSVSLSLDDASRLPAIMEDLQQLGTVRVEKARAIICIVGEGLRGTPGIAASVFSTIPDINITLISQGASSINLTFAIEEERVAEAVNRLHDAFFADGNPTTGGNVENNWLKD